MTDIIITFVPFLAAVAFFIRARGEQKARLRAEQRAAELQRSMERTELYHREWLATLAHELRTPIAAIVGYGELIADGLFGTLDQRGVDALTRIRAIADQILHLADGVDRVAEDDTVAGDDPLTFSAAELLNHAVAALQVDADAREVALRILEPDALLHTRPADSRRALELVLGAALKSSPGHTIDITAQAGAVPAILINHTRLDPLRDDPAWILENTPDSHRPHITGHALRIGMARRIVESSLQGQIHLTATPDGCTVRLDLPRLD